MNFLRSYCLIQCDHPDLGRTELATNSTNDTPATVGETIKKSPASCECQWNHFMMTSSNGNLFRVTGHLCREFTSHRWIPCTKASGTELWCFLWSAPSKLLSRQWRNWWFQMPLCSLWRHCNVLLIFHLQRNPMKISFIVILRELGHPYKTILKLGLHKVLFVHETHFN